MKREAGVFDEDDPYDCWIWGLEMMEMGANTLLNGVKLQTKGVKMMAKRHAEKEAASESDL